MEVTTLAKYLQQPQLSQLKDILRAVAHDAMQEEKDEIAALFTAQVAAITRIAKGKPSEEEQGDNFTYLNDAEEPKTNGNHAPKQEPSVSSESPYVYTAEGRGVTGGRARQGKGMEKISSYVKCYEPEPQRREQHDDEEVTVGVKVIKLPLWDLDNHNCYIYETTNYVVIDNSRHRLAFHRSLLTLATARPLFRLVLVFVCSLMYEGFEFTSNEMINVLTRWGNSFKTQHWAGKLHPILHELAVLGYLEKKSGKTYVRTAMNVEDIRVKMGRDKFLGYVKSIEYCLALPETKPEEPKKEEEKIT